MVYTIDFFNSLWKKTRSQEIDSTALSEEKVNYDVLQQYIVMYNANQRTSTAHSKTRAEVAGSGRKLYKQKGTGNARVWDAWSPIRRKWWVAFWPSNEANYKKTMTKTMKKLAFLTAFYDKLKSDSVLWVEDCSSLAKTKDSFSTLSKIGVSGTKTLVVADRTDAKFMQTVRNIPWIICVYIDSLNAYDVVNCKKILFVNDVLWKLSV